MGNHSGPCSFDGCSRPVLRRGLCNSHYRQALRGESLAPVRKLARGDVPGRLASYSNRTGDCWLWTGALDQHGYGMIRIDGRLRKAHRVALEQAVGPIPSGMQVDHVCHNRACVRPDHLQVVTNKENQENRQVGVNNTSGVRGVSWNPVQCRWQASVRHNGRKYSAGSHMTLEKAEAAVVAKRFELFSNNLLDMKQ